MIPIRPDVVQAVPPRVVEHYLRPGILSLAALPPLSLYVHFPWCVRKCPYCDFNSHEADGSFPERDYLNALRADLEQALPLVWGRKIVSIFIGGGTPSLMSAQALDQLMSDIRSLLPLDGAAEITMEANPGTFEADKFRAFAAAVSIVSRWAYKVSTHSTSRHWAVFTMAMKRDAPLNTRALASRISIWI